MEYDLLAARHLITCAIKGNIRNQLSLAHLSPLGWEHINLTGDCTIGKHRPPSVQTTFGRSRTRAQDLALPPLSVL